MSDVTAKLGEAKLCLSQGDHYGARQAVDDALAAYEQAQAEPKQAAEPVAWGMKDKETGLILDVICPATHDELEGDYTIPLFAAPVAQAEQWVPVTERLPSMIINDPWPESPRLLVYEAEFGTQRVATYVRVCEDEPAKWYSACSERWKLDGVTHWMPLPQPPKENQP